MNILNPQVRLTLLKRSNYSADRTTLYRLVTCPYSVLSPLQLYVLTHCGITGCRDGTWTMK
jgi:hypothetical protein